MESKTNGNLFREDEIVVMSRFDKKTGEYVNTVYPKIGGRLRLAHEENSTISINTEIVRNDDSIAVVKAVATTDKGSFSGIGMASVERDERIAPAILELAETRAIARALRFSGFGVEYCSAEEVSHLNGNSQLAPAAAPDSTPEPQPTGADQGKKTSSTPSNKGNGGDKSQSGNGGNVGNGNGRLTAKQHNFLTRLANEQGLTKKELNDRCVEAYGTVADYLTRQNASNLIENMLAAH